VWRYDVGKELGVAYYGFHYPDRARDDFEEMREYHCTAVLLAVSEYDYHIWYPNIIKIAGIAREMGFAVYVNPWAFGKVFGGEAPSVFLQDNPHNRQILSKEFPVAAACFNTEAFRSYFFDAVARLAREEVFNGFFWDEPHYIVTGQEEIFGCLCPSCRERFREQYGRDVPESPDKDFLDFKERSIIDFLQQASVAVKQTDSAKSVTVCLMPFLSAAEQGASWERVCALEELDVFATDPYWSLIGKDMNFVRSVSRDTVAMAQKHGKRSQLWIQGFLIPAGHENEVQDAGRIIGESNVDSIFCWAYRSCEGSIVQSENPRKVWSKIKELYGEINSTVL